MLVWDWSEPLLLFVLFTFPTNLLFECLNEFFFSYFPMKSQLMLWVDGVVGGGVDGVVGGGRGQTNHLTQLNHQPFKGIVPQFCCCLDICLYYGYVTSLTMSCAIVSVQLFLCTCFCAIVFVCNCYGANKRHFWWNSHVVAMWVVWVGCGGFAQGVKYLHRRSIPSAQCAQQQKLLLNLTLYSMLSK